MTSDTATVPPMVDRKQQATDAILDAASQLLASEGPQALTMRRIAAESGGTTMSLYTRFGGKDGIVEALFREGFRRLGEAMAAAAETDDALDDLMRCGRRYREFALANPAYYSVMFDQPVAEFEPSAEAVGEALATLDQLAARVRRAIDSGALAEADEFEVAASLWATNHGLVSLEMLGKHRMIDWSVVYTATFAALIRGLGPTARRSGG